MIDWTSAMQLAEDKKKASELAIKQAEEEKKQKEDEAKIQNIANKLIFDKVIAEEIDGIKILLSKYSNLIIEVGNGNLHFELKNNNIGFIGETSIDFVMVAKAGEDLATYTKTRLSNFVTWLILYWLK